MIRGKKNGIILDYNTKLIIKASFAPQGQRAAFYFAYSLTASPERRGALNLLAKAGKSIRFYLKNTDLLLIALCAAASLYGLVLVYSAAKGATGGYIVQLASICAGLVVATIISQIDYEFIAALWPVWGGISLVLVFLTYTGLGLNVGGTDDTAWLGISVGSLQLTFQPSELLKIVFIITFSKHLSMVREHINQFKTFLLVALHGLVPIALIFKQGDDGTMLVFVFMVVSMMFAAGVKLVYFLGGATLVGAVIPFLWDRLIADKLDRFLCLIYVDDYIMETGWQQYLGLRALGSGQLWGRGFMEGGNNGLYARNNDFIFTVAGEEFGFIGAMAVLVLIALIVWELWRCAITARDRLGMFMCIGLMSMIGFQSLINIGMTLRLLPVIGITLPFFSSGGSSVATLYLGVGLALSVYYSSRARVRNNIFTKPL